MYRRGTDKPERDNVVKKDAEVFVIASRGCGKSLMLDVEIKNAIKEGKKIVII